MILTIDQMIDDILRREGGYVNNPNDRGGPTKYGVTQATLSAWRGRPVTARDVANLTIDEAKLIFKRRYFDDPRIAELPAILQPNVFDMYVNAGGNAIRILQRTLRKFGATVSVDGALGPQSIGAAQAVAAQAGEYLNDAYAIDRRDYYYRLADKTPSQRVFARKNDGGKGGWIVRAEEFMNPKYRLSADQHKERVATWH